MSKDKIKPNVTKEIIKNLSDVGSPSNFYIHNEDFMKDDEEMKRKLKGMSDPNVENVIDLIKTRSENGLEEYNTDTTRKDYNVLDWLNEAQCEMLDGAIYLEVLKKKYKEIDDLVNKYPNDSELGRVIRSVMSK